MAVKKLMRIKLQTAKLITTFSAAVAATFVVTSLAEGPALSGWDEGAVAAMGVATLGVLAVVFRDRTAPDVQHILDQASEKIGQPIKLVKNSVKS